MAGSREHGNKSSGSVKSEEFTDEPSVIASFSRRTLFYGVSGCWMEEDGKL
jgi:hypothetical protein